MSEKDKSEAEPLLGKSSGIIPLHDAEGFRKVSRHMAEQATRQMDIFTYNLDSRVYDKKPFLRAVKKFALSTGNARIRILLQNNNRVQKEGHRLLDLARRLPSRIEIRRHNPEYIDHGENFMVVDATGYVRRRQHDQYEGEADFNDRHKATSYRDLFSAIWECSEPDSELRIISV
jgi:hypothetical protein